MLPYFDQTERRPQKKMEDNLKKNEKNGRRPKTIIKQAQICAEGCEGGCL